MSAVAFVAPISRKWFTSTSARAAYTYIPASSTIPAPGATANEADPLVHIKLFDPMGSWVWFLIEADPATGEAFGLVKGFEVELGGIDLNELASATTGMRLPIERDIHFKPLPLSTVREKLERGEHV
jgi:hypothetical protein